MSAQSLWLRSQHARNERPRKRSQWFGYHAERAIVAPQFDGLFQSHADCQTDLWLMANSVDQDEFEPELGGEG